MKDAMVTRGRQFVAGLGAAVACAAAVLTPQEPAPQRPADAGTSKRIDTLIKQLEIKELRKETMLELGEVGAVAAPQLDVAIAAEVARPRPEMIDTLCSARARLAIGRTARAFDLPPEPVTLIADYSDNCVVLVDKAGRRLHEIPDMFGPWDACFTDAGTILITEFSVSRVQEVDRKGHVVWEYENLKNPYAAARLPNGNTLIADAFGARVIEVTPDKKVVWKYDRDIRPFHAARLPDGNTLIADVLQDRVIEINPAGEIVWQVADMNNVHDAERLANGNTLITLRSAGKVIEVDRRGLVVWELNGLSSPSDADRLPNGHTLVAENTQVREFDAGKQVVWRHEMTWAVEANRY